MSFLFSVICGSEIADSANHLVALKTGKEANLNTFKAPNFEEGDSQYHASGTLVTPSFIQGMGDPLVENPDLENVDFEKAQSALSALEVFTPEFDDYGHQTSFIEVNPAKLLVVVGVDIHSVINEAGLNRIQVEDQDD